MKTNFRSALTVSLLASLWIAFGGGATAKAQQHGEADMAGYTPVSYCELVRHPKEYDGKNVAVRASYRYGFEWQEMFCIKCRDQGKTWLEFEAETASAVRRALGKAPRHQGTLNATFYGTFRGAKGPYGDGGYVFRFDVKSVKAVEIVSKDGWAPERLSASEQQKLCLGDEEKPPVTEKKH
jgi:hypothetical protein